jgi:hypothetical protein
MRVTLLHKHYSLQMKLANWIVKEKIKYLKYKEINSRDVTRNKLNREPYNHKCIFFKGQCHKIFDFNFFS